MAHRHTVPSLRQLVRAALQGGAVHGLEIVRHIKANPATRWWHRFFLACSGIYPLLHQMEDAGELTSFEEDVIPPFRGGIPRRRYLLLRAN